MYNLAAVEVSSKADYKTWDSWWSHNWLHLTDKTLADVTLQVSNSIEWKRNKCTLKLVYLSSCSHSLWPWMRQTDYVQRTAQLLAIRLSLVFFFIYILKGVQVTTKCKHPSAITGRLNQIRGLGLYLVDHLISVVHLTFRISCFCDNMGVKPVKALVFKKATDDQYPPTTGGRWLKNCPQQK